MVRAENLRFKEEGVRDVLKDVLLPWYNAYRFFIQNVLRLQKVWTAVLWLSSAFPAVLSWVCTVLVMWRVRDTWEAIGKVIWGPCCTSSMGPGLLGKLPCPDSSLTCRRVALDIHLVRQFPALWNQWGGVGHGGASERSATFSE